MTNTSMEEDNDVSFHTLAISAHTLRADARKFVLWVVQTFSVPAGALFRPAHWGFSLLHVLNRVGFHHLMCSGWKCCTRKCLRLASCYYCRLRRPTTSSATRPLNAPGKGFPHYCKSLTRLKMLCEATFRGYLPSVIISSIVGLNNVDKHYCRCVRGLFPCKSDTSLPQDKTLICYLIKDWICLIFPKRL